MRTRCNTILISALIISFCLVTAIPAGLRDASTWKELYFEWSGPKIQNFLMPIGFAYLGIETIGLIVLWTGYRKGERWAWFVMLVILLCSDFPLLRAAGDLANTCVKLPMVLVVGLVKAVPG